MTVGTGSKAGSRTLAGARASLCVSAIWPLMTRKHRLRWMFGQEAALTSCFAALVVDTYCPPPFSDLHGCSENKYFAHVRILASGRQTLSNSSVPPGKRRQGAMMC